MRPVRSLFFCAQIAGSAASTLPPVHASCDKAWLSWKDEQNYNCDDYGTEGWCANGNVTDKYAWDWIETNGYTAKELCPACMGCEPAKGDKIDTKHHFWDLTKALAAVCSIYAVLQLIIFIVYWKCVRNRKMKDIQTDDVVISPYDSFTAATRAAKGPVFDDDKKNTNTLMQPLNAGKMGASYVKHCDISEATVQPGRVLGQGAFGRVYLGKNKDTGTLMAVKEIMMPHMNDADLDDAKGDHEIAEMMNELAVLQMVDHPNIVPYLAHEFVRTEPQKLLIFLAYIPGGTVKSQLEDYGAFSDGLVQKYTRGLVIAIEYLHSLDPPVIHRDLKTANMLLTMSGDIKIADFGCAKVRKLVDAKTSQQTVKGTMPYMAPEAYFGKEVSCAHDIWSLGCCTLEMCTAKPPWHEKSIGSVMDAFRLIAMSQDLPVAPVDRPKVLIQFIYGQCLVRDPKKRADAPTLKCDEFFTKTFHDSSDTARHSRAKRKSSVSSAKETMKTVGGGQDVTRSCPVGKSGASTGKKERRKKSLHVLGDSAETTKSAPLSPSTGTIKSPSCTIPDLLSTNKKKTVRSRTQSRRRSSKNSGSKAAGKADKSDADKLNASDRTRNTRSRVISSRRKKERSNMLPEVDALE
eukprot:GEMP01003658.1.p1 GENE.GEMP01003658.1~~GEMP01003658.1.p1  ORF type:complete len:632 (+),score=130.03 GEMP01003658.1:257-2152(+)